MSVRLWNELTSSVLVLKVGSLATCYFGSCYRWYDWLEYCIGELCQWRRGLTRRARYISCRFCVHGLDRSSDVPRVMSHIVILWMQFGMQVRTFRGVTHICHYSDNSSPVLFSRVLTWKKLCQCVAQIYICNSVCEWVRKYVCAEFRVQSSEFRV